jgi:hypothetical protein
MGGYCRHGIGWLTTKDAKFEDHLIGEIMLALLTFVNFMPSR